MKTVFCCRDCHEQHETEKKARDCCEPNELYECPQCKMTWETISAARECCPIDPTYVCEACEESHDDEGKAANCCASGLPSAEYLERHGQPRLIP